MTTKSLFDRKNGWNRRIRFACLLMEWRILSFHECNSDGLMEYELCIIMYLNLCYQWRYSQRGIIRVFFSFRSATKNVVNKQIITTLQFSIFNLRFFHIYSSLLQQKSSPSIRSVKNSKKACLVCLIWTSSGVYSLYCSNNTHTHICSLCKPFQWWVLVMIESFLFFTR